MPELRDGDVERRGILRLEHRRRPEHLRHLLPQVSDLLDLDPLRHGLLDLRNFSSTETLCSDNKFKCDTCSSYQVLTMLSLLSIDDVGQLDDNQNDQNDPDPYFYL